MSACLAELIFQDLIMLSSFCSAQIFFSWLVQKSPQKSAPDICNPNRFAP
jgi:hypothetical protein